MELLKRIISAFVMIAVCVTAIFLGEKAIFAVCCIVEFLMMFDVINALNSGELGVSKIILLSSAVLIIPAVYFYKSAGYVIVLTLAVTALAIKTVFDKKHDVKSLIAGFFTLVYPLLPGTMMLIITANDIKNSEFVGTELIIGNVLCACLADAFAYFGGRTFGKRKLCPEISPKKTVAGSVSSFFGGILGGFIMMIMTENGEIGSVAWIVIGLLCGGFAQIGDLIASMLKRFCGIKDYGKYIPGHGGIMDRMDSISICIFATVPVVHIFFTELL